MQLLIAQIFIVGRALVSLLPAVRYHSLKSYRNAIEINRWIGEGDTAHKMYK